MPKLLFTIIFSQISKLYFNSEIWLSTLYSEKKKKERESKHVNPWAFALSLSLSLSLSLIIIPIGL